MLISEMKLFNQVFPISKVEKVTQLYERHLSPENRESLMDSLYMQMQGTKEVKQYAERTHDTESNVAYEIIKEMEVYFGIGADLYESTCPNCGEFIQFREEDIRLDEMGAHIECPRCQGTHNIEE